MTSIIRRSLTIFRQALDGGIGRWGLIRSIARLGEDKPRKRMHKKSLVPRMQKRRVKLFK